jgi:LCP family protein required for cell wall assembly
VAHPEPPDTDFTASTLLSGDADDAATAAGQPGGRRWLRVLALIMGLVLVLVGGGAGTAWYYVHSVDNSINRVDAFVGVPEADRPTKPAESAKAMNLLILGSDSRNPDSTGGSRSDTIMLAHIPAGRDKAQLISIPRDTWVTLPKAANGSGGGPAKINAAFAFGGVPLMVRAVESFTRVRIDHVLLVDFAGFKDIIDALGGIEVAVDRTFTSVHPPLREFVKGDRLFDGEQALDYARQRKQFPDGDFTRIKHQQQVVLAALSRAGDSGLLSDPGRLNDFVKAVARAISVDKTLSLIDTASQLRDLRSGNVTFLTSPSRGTGMVGGQSVVFADTAAAKALYEAVSRDELDAWLTAHPNAAR